MEIDSLDTFLTNSPWCRKKGIVLCSVFSGELLPIEPRHYFILFHEVHTDQRNRTPC